MLKNFKSMPKNLKATMVELTEMLLRPAKSRKRGLIEVKPYIKKNSRSRRLCFGTYGVNFIKKKEEYLQHEYKKQDALLF